MQGAERRRKRHEEENFSRLKKLKIVEIKAFPAILLVC
jgi:hypothetical protein